MWYQVEMDYLLVGVGEFQCSGFDGVYIINQVGNIYVWCSQFFYVVFVVVYLVDGCIVVFFCNQVQCIVVQWLQGIIVKVVISNDWYIFVQ